MSRMPHGAGKSSFEFLDGEAFFKALSLRGTERLLDLCSGRGDYAVELAWRLPEGTVLAFDLWEEGIRELVRRAGRMGLYNLYGVLADAGSGIPLKDRSVDLVLVAAALHDLVRGGGHEAALSDVARALKPGGRLFAVEFKKIEGPPGPPREVRLSPEELEGLLRPWGFTREAVLDLGPFLYLQVSRRVG